MYAKAGKKGQIILSNWVVTGKKLKGSRGVTHITVLPLKAASVFSSFLMHLQPFRNNVVFQLPGTLSTLTLLDKWSVHTPYCLVNLHWEIRDISAPQPCLQVQLFEKYK